MTSIYLIGSLRNESIPLIGNRLTEMGLDVFDDWHEAGPKADDSWKAGEIARGRSYKDALRGWAARHVFEFDKKHLDRCDGAILVLPAGKSAHLELGYVIGCGKPGWVLFDNKQDRWDVMYNFATDVFFNMEDLIAGISSWSNVRQKEFQFSSIYESR